MSKRDIYVPKHPTPTRGTPEFVDEECTGRYEDEDDLLAAREARAEQNPAKRIAILETEQKQDRRNHDSLVKVVTETRVEVAKISGQLEVLPDLVELIKGKQQTEHKTERVRINSRARVIIAIVGAVGTAIGIAITSALSGCI
jgi:hypothetical protein